MSRQVKGMAVVGDNVRYVDFRGRATGDYRVASTLPPLQGGVADYLLEPVNGSGYKVSDLSESGWVFTPEPRPVRRSFWDRLFGRPAR